MLMSLMLATALIALAIPSADCALMVGPAKHQAQTTCCAHKAPEDQPAKPHDSCKRICVGCLGFCCGAVNIPAEPAVALKSSDNGTAHHFGNEVVNSESIALSIFHPPRAA
jgi:hypothetical protein